MIKQLLEKLHIREWRNYPMAAGLTGSALLLSLLAVSARQGVFASYASEDLMQPAVRSMLVAAHDGVFLWSGDGETPEDVTGTEVFDQVLAALSGAGDAEEDDAGGEAATEPGGTSTAQEAGSEAASGEDDAEDETALPGQEEEVPVITELPETVCSPVMDATDFGLADMRYMVAPETEFPYDTEGMFAPDGTYFPLVASPESYFADALFIGDSRTDGLYDYGGLKDKASFIAKESLSVYRLFDKELRYHAVTGEEARLTLSDLLQNVPFGKIYLSVGINELGIADTQHFYEYYRAAVAQIRAWQPQAVIYLQGIMHVTADRSASDPVFNNTIIVQRNRAIASLANGRDIFYIDANPAVCDEEGNLIAEYSSDQIHLKAATYLLWTDFLTTHTAQGAEIALWEKFEQQELTVSE